MVDHSCGQENGCLVVLERDAEVTDYDDLHWCFTSFLRQVADQVFSRRRSITCEKQRSAGLKVLA